MMLRSMSRQEQSEKLVQVYRARNEWEGSLVLGYLHDNGVEATLRAPPVMPPVDYYELFNRNETIDGIFVLEHQAIRAHELIADFLVAPTDESSLEELAAKKEHPGRETIHRLRIAVREERRTFEFIGWLVIAFCVAGWLLVATPVPPGPWTSLVLLVIIALLVGSWSRRRL